MLLRIFHSANLKAANILAGILLVAASSIASQVMAANIETQKGAPAGFEQLEAPRLTSVTVYYGGELIGNFPAHFTPNTLRFNQPEQIIKLIPSLLKPKAVAAVLGADMPAHAELQCNSHRIDNCGRLQPEVAGVIFDENHLSAEVFFGKDYLSVIDQDAQRYLPLPDRHFSSVYNLSGAVSGADSGVPTFSVSNMSIYSFGEAQINANSTVTNNGLRFDTAAASIDRNGWTGSTGLFRSKPMQLVSDYDMAGISFSTSRRTLLDSRKTEGNDIIVYLPRRSLVSIYREGRLYSSRAYDAGNQRIDTADLPDGAYNITLKIQESDGQMREETRFFAKTQNIPAAGSPTYYLQTGLMRKPASQDSTLPQVTEHPIIRAGTAQRLDDNLGISFSVLGLEDRAIAEPGAFWLYNNSQLTTTVLASTQGDIGFQAGYIYSQEKLSFAADFRKVWIKGGAMPGDQGNYDMSDDAQQADTPVMDLTQASLTVSYAFRPDLTFGVRGSYSEQTNMQTMTSLGPYAEWHVWQEGENMLLLTADAARTGEEYEGSVFLHFSHRFGNYGVTGALGNGFGKSGTGPTGNVHVWHDDPTPGNALLVAAGFDGNGQTKTVSSDAHWRNSFGQIEGGAQKSYGQSSAFSYGGNFAVNAAQLADSIHVGGDQNEKSAVVVSTDGDAESNMRIYVNNTLRGVVRVGEQQTVYLTPFHSYNIRISPEKGGLFDYENGDKKITVYPGNVVQLDYHVNKFYVVTGRVVTPAGKPLANALLKESATQNTTNDKGHIQAELSKPDVLTFTTEGGATCQARLPHSVKPVHGVIIYREDLFCSPVTETAAR